MAGFVRLNNTAYSCGMSDIGLHIFHRPPGLVAIVLYKAVWGSVESALGVLSLLSAGIVVGELAEDPQDLLINWILAHTPYAPAIAVHVGVLFAVLGVSKIGIAIGLWFRSWKMRRALLWFLGIVTAFTLVDVTISWSIFTVVALVADGVALYYLWAVLPKHLHAHKIM